MNSQTQYGKHPQFIVHQDTPFNGGSPAALLRASAITPVDQFYVRAHAPVPIIDAAAYRLEVKGFVNQPLSLSLAQLQHDFPKRTLMATLQCAGNRRRELSEVAPMPGEAVMWNTEAISNAVWGGVSLADVLKQAGIAKGAAHIEFISLDQVAKGAETFGYGSSISLEKALQPEVLLAYEMNGEPLQPVHGYPLRVVVPGYIAARSVKWVGEINVTTEPSSNFYQRQDYKLFPKDVSADSVDWSQGEMLSRLNTDAVICLPTPDTILPTGDISVKGYAMPGGDAEIVRVEVSADDSMTWHEAVLQGESQPYVWRFWEVAISLSVGDYTLVVRAHDSRGTMQPAHAADIWNFRGYMNNSYHRVNIRIR